MPRVVVFIDNSNVFKNLSSLVNIYENKWIKQYNPLVLAEKLSGKRELLKVIFYCAPPPKALLIRSPSKFATQQSYYYKVSELPNVEVKFSTLTGKGDDLHEKNLDTQLTADAIVMAARDEYDHAIIIANDGDFVGVVEAVKSMGKKVEVGYFDYKMSMNLKKSADVTRKLRPSYFVKI